MKRSSHYNTMFVVIYRTICMSKMANDFYDNREGDMDECQAVG